MHTIVQYIHFFNIVIEKKQRALWLHLIMSCDDRQIVTIDVSGLFNDTIMKEWNGIKVVGMK